jgi:hypothetical protein
MGKRKEEGLAPALAVQQASDTGTVDPVTIARALAQLEEALPSGIVLYLRQAAGRSPQSVFRPVPYPAQGLPLQVWRSFEQ